MIEIAATSRDHPRIQLGVSPRGLLIWQRVCQAWAFLQGRPFVTPDDVQAMARPVLRVRLGVDTGDVDERIEELLTKVDVPIYTQNS